MTAPAATTNPGTTTAPPTTSSGSPMPDIYARRLSDRLQYQANQIQTISQAQRIGQLGNSSIENDWVNMYDAAGQLALRLGLQPDSTWAVKYVEGTPPPVPAIPNVEPGEGSIRVGVDGSWAVPGTKPPENLARFDIHASKVQGFTVASNTAYSSLPKEGGVESFPAGQSDWYVKVVAVTNAGVKSGASEEVHVLPYPFQTLAAYSVGAEQLKSTIILSSRIIVGDPTSKRFEMEPIAGFTSYNSQNQRTWWVDPDTGNVTMYGRLMSDPAGSDSNIVFGERDGNSKATLKFAMGTPANNAYSLYVSAIARSRTYQYVSINGAAPPSGPEMRIMGPAFRYYNSYMGAQETNLSRAFLTVSDGLRMTMNKQSDSNNDTVDETATDIAQFALTPYGLSYQGNVSKSNDNWQFMIDFPRGENTYGNNVGMLGWYTRGSGAQWVSGLKWYAANSYNFAAPNTRKLSGPDLGIAFCTQPDARFRDHRDQVDQKVYGSQFIATCGVQEKFALEEPPVAEGQYLAAARSMPPIRHYYNGEDPRARDAHMHFSIAAEDLEDNGFGWMVRTRPGRTDAPGTNDEHDKKGVGNFEMATFLLGVIRDLDAELDEMRKALKVGLPRREKRIHGRRGKK